MVAWGEQNGHCKLTDEQVKQLRAEAEQRRLKQRELAAMYGVSQAAISKILKKKSRPSRDDIPRDST